MIKSKKLTINKSSKKKHSSKKLSKSSNSTKLSKSNNSLKKFDKEFTSLDNLNELIKYYPFEKKLQKMINNILLFQMFG